MIEPDAGKPRIRTRAPSRKRAPGRPAGKRRDADAGLRPQLLDAAVACFVRKGIAATTLREIAREAHVTPALLNYYFGDKAQLQAALVEERLMPVLALLREPLQQAGDDVAANIAGFGILWVLKYVFLDKIMFGPDHHTPYDEDIELEEAALGHQPPS